VHERDAGGPAENLPHVVGGGEVVQLHLRDVERGFE